MNPKLSKLKSFVKSVKGCSKLFQDLTCLYPLKRIIEGFYIAFLLCCFVLLIFDVFFFASKRRMWHSLTLNSDPTRRISPETSSEAWWLAFRTKNDESHFSICYLGVWFFCSLMAACELSAVWEAAGDRYDYLFTKFCTHPHNCLSYGKHAVFHTPPVNCVWHL